MRFPAPIAAPLLAAGLACVASHASHAATLVVAVNHSLRLPVAGRAASVVLGNAAVADVTVVDSHTLFVTGKSPGSTDVAVVDPLGRTVFAADIAVSQGSGRPVTIHRATETAEVSCDPRCLVAGQPKPTGMAALMTDLAGISAAKQAASTSPIATAASGSLDGAAGGGLPFGLSAPR